MQSRKESFQLAVVLWFFAVVGLIVVIVIGSILNSISSPASESHAASAWFFVGVFFLSSLGIVSSLPFLMMSLIGGVLVPSLLIKFNYLFVPLAAFIGYLLHDGLAGDQIPALFSVVFNALGFSAYTFYFLRLDRQLVES